MPPPLPGAVALLPLRDADAAGDFLDGAEDFLPAADFDATLLRLFEVAIVIG